MCVVDQLSPPGSRDSSLSQPWLLGLEPAGGSWALHSIEGSGSVLDQAPFPRATCIQ